MKYLRTNLKDFTKNVIMNWKICLKDKLVKSERKNLTFCSSHFILHNK